MCYMLHDLEVKSNFHLSSTRTFADPIELCKSRPNYSQYSEEELIGDLPHGSLAESVLWETEGGSLANDDCLP